MKRFICLLLILSFALGMFACGNAGTANNATEPSETKAAVQKDDGVLKILLFGHSLGNDSIWMLPDVFTNESPDTKIVLGFLYYSGCPVAKHVQYAEEKSAVYAYCEFDSQKDTYWRVALGSGEFRSLTRGDSLDAEIPGAGIGQTSYFAMQQHDWDIILTQGYPWEVTKVPDNGYDPDLSGNYQKLQQYMLDNDIDKETTPQFGWNMVWTFPDDDDLIRERDRQIMTQYFGTVDKYYTKTAEVVRDELMPKFNFDYVLPASTAYINALSGYKTTKEMYRDFAHASDFGRLMVAYLWYCGLTGTNIADCKFAPIDYNYMKDEMLFLMKQDVAISEEDKQTIIEVVGNALAKPYEITPKA